VTARPASITAASSAVLSLVVYRARNGSWSVAAMKVRRAQPGSAHTNLGLRTTTSTPAGMRDIAHRCITQACTRDDTTAALRAALVKINRLYLDAAAAQRQIDRLDHPGSQAG
jgi:hypothetical protein